MAIAERLSPLLQEDRLAAHLKRIEELLRNLTHSAPTVLAQDTFAAHRKVCEGLEEKYAPNIKEFTGD